MPTVEKNEDIKKLNDKFARAKAAILTDYQGITAPAITQLRAHMRTQSVDFFVIKNTLARLAAKDTHFEALDLNFKGPVSVVVSYEDPIAPAKALAEYSKTQPEKEPEILCGLVEGRKISAQEVQMLAKLPPREVLIAQLLSTMQAPTSNFVGVFQSLLRKFVGTLEAIKEKKLTD